MNVRPTGKTILVADDDLEVRNYFETILKLQGYDVLLADSGEEALRRPRRWWQARGLARASGRDDAGQGRH